MDAFIEEAMNKEYAHSTFPSEVFLEILKILGVPPILPGEEEVEYHVTFKFKGKTQSLAVYVVKTYWSIPYFYGDEYLEDEVEGYDIYTFHEE